MKTLRKHWILLLLMPLVISCASIGMNQKKMPELAANLIKLSSAVETTVRYENPPPGISDIELLRMATQHDPSLLTPFDDYSLRVLRQNQHAMVLVCTKDSKYALLEDAGCTGRMEKNLWKENPLRPCEFTLTVEESCMNK